MGAVRPLNAAGNGPGTAPDDDFAGVAGLFGPVEIVPVDPALRLAR
jgi:hypothetical protein